MNEADEVTLKAQAHKGSLDEILFQPVKGFCQINFEEKSLLPPCLQIERMHDFLSDDNVGGYVHVLDKSSLSLINEIREVRFESISKRFSYDFIDNIA